MASPIGHACIGVAAAAIVARATGTPPSVALWVGAVVASGLPDLDLLSEVVGRKGPRFHRNATHSLLVIAVLGAGIVLASRWAGLTYGLAASWIVSLVSHPFLDVATTGPAIAAHGYGIALWWPISKRRYFVPRPIVVSPNLEGCRSLADVWNEVRVEVITLVPIAVVVVLASSIW